MSRVMRDQRRRVTGGHSIKISGKNVNIYFARIAYKCESCFGDLEIHGAGLRCKTNHDHRNFVHRDEITKLQKQQEKNIDDLKEFYQIIDGKVVIKNGN